MRWIYTLLILSFTFFLTPSCSRHNPTGKAGYSISGRIVAEDGQDIQDVIMSIQGCGKRQMEWVDISGKYNISVLSDGIYILKPAGPGYTFLPDSVAVKVNGTDILVDDIVATGKRSIYGRVTDVAGKAVPGVNISLSGEQKAEQTVTGEDGGYAFPLLPDGTYRVVPEKNDMRFNRIGTDVEIRNHQQLAVNLTAFSPPNCNVDVRSFLGLEISRSNPGIKVYPVPNAEMLAAQYRMKGMGWFAPNGLGDTKLDERGIPLDIYPVHICNIAFTFYKYYTESGYNSSRTFFLNNVDWLLENRDSNSYLYYTFFKEHYPGLVWDVPWVSAMAQGEALAATSMAYNLTGDRKYLDAARGFFATLYCNTGGFWCFGVDSEGYYWPEEYPNRDFCHVLNGMIFCLWGLWDYYTVSGDEFALTLFEAGIRSIVDHYPYYWVDSGKFCSRYCLHFNRTCGETYHTIHLTQFQTYAEFFHIPEFWDAYRLLLAQ